MMKKILALILAMVMLVTFFACTTSGGGDNKPDPTSGEDTPTEVIDYSEGGKYLNLPGANGNMAWRLPAYTFKSNIVTIMNHFEIEQPKLEYFSALRDGYEIMTQTNVVAPEDRMTKFTAAIMGDEAPDVFQWGYSPAIFSKGLAIPWDPYIDFSLGLWDDFRDSVESLKFKGKYYVTGVQQARWDNMIFYNKEIFSDLGLKTPLEYYEEGNWTWDTMRELAIQATVDSDGDGNPEIWGLATGPGVQFVTSTGKEFVTVNPDGTATNNMKSEELSRAISFFIQLITVDQCCMYGDGKVEFPRGTVAMSSPNAAWYANTPEWKELQARDAMGAVVFPRDPQADKYYVGEQFGDYLLCKGAQNPEGAAAWVQSMLYDKLNTDVQPEMSDDEFFVDHWARSIQDAIEDQCYSDDKFPVPIMWGAFTIGDYWGEIWFFTQLGTPWSSTAEELYPKVQEKIDTAMNG